MIMELVGYVLHKQSQFPVDDDVSDKLSHSTIIYGVRPPYFNKMKLEYGQYVQAFQDNKITNSNGTRSIRAIALSVKPNKSGEY